MKTLITLIFMSFVFGLRPADVSAERRLSIKYRPDSVDVDTRYFESLDTSKSSWIRGAWYDKANKYMIINLNGTNYHYCGLDSGTWVIFKGSESFGNVYNRTIKGRFDCRIHSVPSYMARAQ